MKKILKVLLLSTVLTSGAALASCNNGKEVIAIIKFGTHTSLDEIESSCIKELNAKLGENSPYVIKTYDCAFSNDLITQTITGLKNSKLGAIVPIATPVAQVAANMFSDTPIIFSAVSDPIGAKLLDDISKPSGNVTGTSDEIQVSSLVDKALLIDPSLDEIGFIYNPLEANSVTNKRKLEEYAKTKNISIISKTISNSAEMTEVANAIVDKVDAVLVTDDNTVASNMTVLSNILREKKIPCYTGADSMVYDGGMLCVGINYTTLGTYTADMVYDVLNGTSISNLPVKVFNDNLNIYLNEDYIEQTGIIIPSEILNDERLIKVKDKAI